MDMKNGPEVAASRPKTPADEKFDAMHELQQVFLDAAEHYIVAAASARYPDAKTPARRAMMAAYYPYANAQDEWGELLDVEEQVEKNEPMKASTPTPSRDDGDKSGWELYDQEQLYLDQEHVFLDAAEEYVLGADHQDTRPEQLEKCHDAMVKAYDPYSDARKRFRELLDTEEGHESAAHPNKDAEMCLIAQHRGRGLLH